MPPGFLVMHDAPRAPIRRAETLPSERVKAGLSFDWGRFIRIGKVTMGERAEVTIRSMSFCNQEPVQRRAGVGGLQRSGEPTEGRSQRLVSPIAMMDDGVAR